MNLDEIIYKRKSHRHFKDEKLDEKTLNSIEDFIYTIEPLFDIETKFKITDKTEIRTPLRWYAPHYLAIFSKNAENYLINVGFIYQQVDLYLQLNGLGSCWIGLGSYTGDKIKCFEFIIFIGFGKVKGELYRNIEDFKRKSLDDISDEFDENLKPVLYAPSAINGQPWYFKHDNNVLDLYQIQPNIIKKRFLSKLVDIDIGIALAHLYLTNKDTFEVFIKDSPSKIKKHKYIISINI